MSRIGASFQRLIYLIFSGVMTQRGTARFGQVRCGMARYGMGSPINLILGR